MLKRISIALCIPVAFALFYVVAMHPVTAGGGVNPYPLLSINGDKTPNQTFITGTAATAYITSNGAGVTTFFSPASGSGSGDVTGPASSTNLSVAAFSGTTGKILVNGQDQQKVNFPVGPLPPSEFGDVNLQFAGTTGGYPVPDKTGINVSSYANGTSISYMINGRQVMRNDYSSGGGVYETTFLGTLRPDTFQGTQIGRGAQNSFTNTYIRSLFFGSNTGGTNPDNVDRCWLLHTGWIDVCIGLDANQGNKWYFDVFDQGASDYLTGFSLLTNNRTTTAAPGPVDGSKHGTSLSLVGGAAENGHGGNVALIGGSSSGGASGEVYLTGFYGVPSSTPETITGAAAVAVNTQDNAFYIYTNGAWRNVANASTTDQIDAYLYGSVTDDTYTWTEYAFYPFTINQLAAKLASGTCTIAVAINGTPVTGLSAVSVTGTQSVTNATAANSVVAGDRITFTVSSGSSPNGLAMSLKFTR
jgi:hypothetical protein